MQHNLDNIGSLLKALEGDEGRAGDQPGNGGEKVGEAKVKQPSKKERKVSVFISTEVGQIITHDSEKGFTVVDGGKPKQQSEKP